jgi:hypothetical protein
MQTLQRNGIKDARVMPESDGTRRVSVGLFSERERAERRVSAVQKMGLKAEVTPRTQPGTVYWVDLMLHQSDSTVPVQDLIPVGAPSSRLSVQFCPSAVQPTAPAAAPAESPPSGTRVPRTTVAGTPKLP